MVVRLAWRSIWRNKRPDFDHRLFHRAGIDLCHLFYFLGEGMYELMVDQAVRMQAGHITLEHPLYGEAPSVDLLLEDSTGLRGLLEGLPMWNGPN